MPRVCAVSFSHLDDKDGALQRNEASGLQAAAQVSSGRRQEDVAVDHEHGPVRSCRRGQHLTHGVIRIEGKTVNLLPLPGRAESRLALPIQVGLPRVLDSPAMDSPGTGHLV